MDINLLDQFLRLIEDHGLSLVLLVLGIAWVYFWLMPKVNDIWKEYSQERLPQKDVDSILQFDLKVKSLLDATRDNLNANWVQLWQFHNGTYNVGLKHIPFLYLSITHEVVADVVPMGLTYHAVPTTFFKDMADNFFTEDLIQSDESSVPFSLGAKTYCLLPIRNEEGHLAALLAVGYSAVHDITPDDAISMKHCSQRLGIFLATALKEG